VTLRPQAADAPRIARLRIEPWPERKPCGIMERLAFGTWLDPRLPAVGRQRIRIVGGRLSTCNALRSLQPRLSAGLGPGPSLVEGNPWRAA
jgi:hypothetical protein